MDTVIDVSFHSLRKLNTTQCPYTSGLGQKSAKGHEQTLKRASRVSALLLKADIQASGRNVRLVPRGDISELYKWKDRLAAASPNSHVFLSDCCTMLKADALEIDIFYDEGRVAATWATGGLAFLKA